MASPDVVFGTTTQLQPVDRYGAKWGMERPDNRNLYYILKEGKTNGLFLQVFQKFVGWQAEYQVHPYGQQTSQGYSRMSFDLQSNLMMAYIAKDVGGTEYLYSAFIPASETLPTIYTQHTLESDIRNYPFGFCLRPPNNFLLCIMRDDAIAGNFELFVKEWDGGTQTWGAELNLGSVAGAGSAGVRNCAIAVNCVSNQFHILAVADTAGTPTDYDLWYINEEIQVWDLLAEADPGSATGYVYSKNLDIQSSPTDPDVMYGAIKLVRNIDPSNAEVQFWVRQIDGWTRQANISNSEKDVTLEGAGDPLMEVDANGDIYAIFTEHDTSTTRMALWFRRRLNSNGLWEDRIKIDESILNTNVGNPSDVGEPQSPGIIRKPPGCTTPIHDFCVTWGDFPNVSDSYVYVTCSFIREEGDNGDGGEELSPVLLNTVYVFDEPAGGPWYKHKGTSTRRLNVTRWLVLDAVRDNGELLFGSTDEDGLAWVNEYLYGNIDLDVEILGRYPSTRFDMGSAGVPKIFRYLEVSVDLQSTDVLQMDLSVDEDRATHTIYIRESGYSMHPLPMRMQGRTIKLTPRFSGTDDPPILYHVGFHFFPKRQLWPRRTITT